MRGFKHNLSHPKIAITTHLCKNQRQLRAWHRRKGAGWLGPQKGGILRWSCSTGLCPDCGGDPTFYHVTELSRTEHSHKWVQVRLWRSRWISSMSISWLQLRKDATIGENQGKGTKDLWVLFLTTAYVSTIIKIWSLVFCGFFLIRGNKASVQLGHNVFKTHGKH